MAMGPVLFMVKNVPAILSPKDKSPMISSKLARYGPKMSRIGSKNVKVVLSFIFRAQTKYVQGPPNLKTVTASSSYRSPLYILQIEQLQ